MPIAWKIFLAFCLAVCVVLGLGLWSLQATRQLHDLNRTLLTRAIPAASLEVTLAELVPTLIRHESRAVILNDPAYQALHRESAQGFQGDLDQLTALLEGLDAQGAVGPVRAAFAAYLEEVEREWEALRGGNPAEARRRSEATTREASAALVTSIEHLRARNQAEITRQVAAAGRLEQRVRAATLLSLTVSVAVGVGLAAMVAVRIARPIRALSRATRLIAQGEYDVPLSVTTRDEVGELARAFREMAQKLREVDARKAEFLENLSHDLRSPLHSIRGAASLLQRGHLDPKEARWLEIIQLDSKRILRLINQILDLAKLRAGTLELHATPTDVRRIAEQAIEELRPEAEEKGVKVAVTIPESMPPHLCDEDRIQQVLANLLANAVKFTPTGGQVTLTAREDGAELILTVEDTGIGIPAPERPHLFDRYHQAHPGAGGGSGLGLAIVKALVEAHGGRVWVESQEHVGSRFHVALPRPDRDA